MTKNRDFFCLHSEFEVSILANLHSGRSLFYVFPTTMELGQDEPVDSPAVSWSATDSNNVLETF